VIFLAAPLVAGDAPGLRVVSAVGVGREMAASSRPGAFEPTLNHCFEALATMVSIGRQSR